MKLLERLARIHPRSKFGRFIRWPGKLIPKMLVVPIQGGITKGYKWVAGSSINGCWAGTYEDGMQQAALRNLKPGMIVYDIGANVGFHSLVYSKLVGSRGVVYAFEPDPNNIVLLQKHIALNGIDNIVVVSAAVSNKNDVVGFQEQASQGRLVANSKYLVRCTTMDDFVKMGFPLPNFVKIDVEGAELDVLEGGRGVINARSAFWLMGDYKPAQCAPHFARSGYTIERVASPMDHENAESDFLARP